MVASMLIYRPAVVADCTSTYDIFLAATDDLRARVNLPAVARTLERRTRALAFRLHALTQDPDGFWVAEAEGRLVGFGISTLRQRVWYLAALHVLPTYQGKGVGRELLRRCLGTSTRGGIIKTTISEANQPISNALYAKHGLYQWAPLLSLVGPVPAVPQPAVLATEVVPVHEGSVALLDGLDMAVLGLTRTCDHRLWLHQPDLLGLLVYHRGEVIGYAYFSRSGAIGPVAARSPRELPVVLAHSIRVATGHGAEHFSLPVPGLCRSALSYLLANGFRYGPSINLILASRPFGHLDRYLPSAGDALF